METFIGYFKSNTGRYHTRIYISDVAGVNALLFTYKAVVPEVVITDGSDLIVAQAVGGKIVFPDYCADAIRYNCDRYPDRGLPAFEDSEARDDYVRREVGALMAMAERPERQERLTDVLALAARDDLNLYRYGYRPVDVVFGGAHEEAA
jgi:hypothetical protein